MLWCQSFRQPEYKARGGGGGWAAVWAGMAGKPGTGEASEPVGVRGLGSLKG